MSLTNTKTSNLISCSFLRPALQIFVIAIGLLFSWNASSQTILVNPNEDGGFEEGNDFTEMGWSVTNDRNSTRNQWVSASGAILGFSGRGAAYVTNNAAFSIPPHKYSGSPARATHIYRDMSVPAGETDIAIDFIWIAEGQIRSDVMRIWIVPTTYLPVFGTAIMPSTDNIQIGTDYYGSNTWNATPTLTIPESYAGTTFRFVVEWINGANLAFDPPAGIDDISIVSQAPPPPSNDEPCNAINLNVNSTCNYQTFTNYGATSTTSVSNPGCSYYRGSDVWFRFTVPASGGFTIDTQDIEVTNSGLAIYSGTCGALNLIECDNNDSGNGLMSLIIRTDRTPGEIIYVRFWSYNNLNNGTFGICITPPPPPPSNDECVDAIGLTVNPTLICNAVTAGSTANATASPQPDDVMGVPDNDVWFSFVATNTTHRISLLDITLVSGTDINLAVGVYYSSSTNCSTLTRIANRNPNIFDITNLTVGGTYYLRVYGYETGANSAQVIFNICVSTPVDPPVNNNCDNAIRLPVLPVCDYETYTNAGATGSTGTPNPGCGNYAGGDVWFYVIVDNTGEITIDTQDLDMTDGAMALYSGFNCNGLTLLDCDNNSSANGQMPSITRTGLTPGERVYIRLWERGNNNNGTFGICATSPTLELTVDAAIPCPGESSDDLYATFSCSGTTSLGSSLSGIMLNTDPVALQPLIFISSEDPCAFDPINTANYSIIDFTVTTTGDYIFNMSTPSPYFDAMGYIVVNDGNFSPGSCATGTWIAGDDDDGPELNPQIRADLIAGVPYRLITTKFAFSSTAHVGPYEWDVIGPPAEVEWYANETGGSPIGSGFALDPVGVSGSGLADTNTPGVYTFWVNCPGSTLPRLKAEFTIGKIWKGTVNSDWNNANNWKPLGKPGPSDCVYIDDEANQPILTYPGAPIPPNPAYAKNLTIANNATLELTSGTSMTVTEKVHLDGTLDIRDSGSLIQIVEGAPNVNNNTGNGVMNMQRTVPGGVNSYDYVYWSSPTDSDFNLTDISSATGELIYEWYPTIATNTNGFGNWSPASGMMSPGKGYIVRGLVSTNPVPPNTTQFSGKPQNGVVTVAITRGDYSGGPYQAAGTILATALDDNWNLIGNPYPSVLSYADFIAANNHIDGTIYFWTHQNAPNAVDSPFYFNFTYNYSDDYLDYNGTGSNPPGFNGNIAAGQAFFVLMEDAPTGLSENVTFNNTMRSQSLNNNQFYKTNTSTNNNFTEIERHRIWLDLINPNQLATSMLVGYVEGATNDNDRLYDGYEFAGSNTSFYSLIGDVKMAIQGKALPFEDTDTVPLGISVPENGNYTIAINTIDGLFENSEQDIYLEDTFTGTIHALRILPYTFTSESGEFNNRFILRYTNDSLSIDEAIFNSDLSITAPNGKYINVTSGNIFLNSITVYDVLGHQIVNNTNLKKLNHIIDTSNISDGIYIVQVELVNGYQKKQKLILKR